MIPHQLATKVILGALSGLPQGLNDPEQVLWAVYLLGILIASLWHMATQSDGSNGP